MPQDNHSLFDNNQGVINGKITQLYLTDKTAMKAYAMTLTARQRSIARDHLATYIAISKTAKERERKREIWRRASTW